MEELTKKERREIRRQEREAGFSTHRRNSRFKKISKWVLVAAVILVAGYVSFKFLTRSEKREDFSREILILGREHVASEVAASDYNSSPPTSGPHWANPASRGVHKEEIPDEQLVHNLEHGEVWISWRPGIQEGVIKELEGIAGDFSKVVLTPRSKNDTDIALAAWGRLDKFNLEGRPLDTKRIEDFIKKYRNKGPELVP